MGRPPKYKLTIPSTVKITEELAYWIGFIVADGCIWKEHGWRFDMNLEAYGKKANQVIETLYKNANIALERKAILAGRI